MAINDIKIHEVKGFDSMPTRLYQVAASATLIYPGEPVRVETAEGTATVVKLADGEPTTSTLTVVGIAAKTSTNTASAAGVVEVYDLAAAPGTVWKAKAKTASTADTQSEIDAKENDCIVLDLTSSTFTVDFAAAHANTNGIQVVGGNPLTKEIYFRFRPVVIQGAIS